MKGTEKVAADHIFSNIVLLLLLWISVGTDLCTRSLSFIFSSFFFSSIFFQFFLLEICTFFSKFFLFFNFFRNEIEKRRRCLEIFLQVLVHSRTFRTSVVQNFLLPKRVELRRSKRKGVHGVDDSDDDVVWVRKIFLAYFGRYYFLLLNDL